MHINNKYHKVTSISTLFSNSLVWTRSALSRKILSLWMERAKIVCIILVLLLSAPEQRQNRSRSGPKSLWMKQHRLRTVKGHTIPLCPEDDVNVYGRVQLPWQLSLIWPSSWMGLRKSSAALLIVCEHNCYCLVRTILVQTESGWVTEKGIRALWKSPWKFIIWTNDL